ncbi:hypothetical protein D3C71_1913810 [compost metagenome]
MGVHQIHARIAGVLHRLAQIKNDLGSQIEPEQIITDGGCSNHPRRQTVAAVSGILEMPLHPGDQIADLDADPLAA